MPQVWLIAAVVTSGTDGGKAGEAAQLSGKRTPPVASQSSTGVFVTPGQVEPGDARREAPGPRTQAGRQR